LLVTLVEIHRLKSALLVGSYTRAASSAAFTRAGVSGA
jgi:hypothetical protein